MLHSRNLGNVFLTLNVDHEATLTFISDLQIEFVESLPKTVSGKIRRVELRQEEWS